MAEITLDNISKEEIIQMAKYIQQLEQITSDQKGYIIQLQAQLMQRGKQLNQMRRVQAEPAINQFINVEAKLEL